LRRLIDKNKWAFSSLVLGIVLILSSVGYYVWFATAGPGHIDWELTITGKDGQQQVLDFYDVKKIAEETARGGYFTTVGVINGPYEVKGAPLQDLCDLVGGISTNDLVSISAPDGYSMVFDYTQLFNGIIMTYDPVDLKEVPHERQLVMLTYEWNGEPISNNDGGPLRLAVVGSEALLTEGHNWVMWVDEIEVIRLD
jgi:DMSO/TMAO reductase YedYZ molybdopterin-dependent catalytic subunit